MTISLAHLGPTGTNAETAALIYAQWLEQKTSKTPILCAYPSIAQSLHAVAREDVTLAIAPVENSTEGSVAMTLDTLWQVDSLQIQQELVLPIRHALITQAGSLTEIKTVYSHPQALAQCQRWLEANLPTIQLIPTNSTTEALQYLNNDPTAAAIAAPRAAKLYDLPILAHSINDYPDNCTRFWILGLNPATKGERVSLAFSVPKNVPGALVKPLEVFEKRQINLTRIESRPTKRSLGEYLFYLDLEGCVTAPSVQEALAELSTYTEVIKLFGSYPLIPVTEADFDRF